MAFEKIVQFFNWAKGVYEGSKALQAIYTGFQIVTGLAGVKGYLQGRQMLAKGQDIMANKVAAGGKLPIIFGTRRVGAQIVYMDTANNSSQNLFVVYALSVGEVDEILLRTLEIDGNPLTDPNQFRNGGYLGSDKISSGAGSLCTANQTSGSVDLAGGTFGTNPALGGYRYVFNAHHGSATQSADPMLRASIGSSWTTSHQLNGVAYIAASFIYDSKGQFSGVPQITVQVRGKKVYDQRQDSTNGGSGSQRIADASTYGYSDNPAIIFQDYILNNEFGKGLASSQLNLSTFTAAANKADALVNQPYYNGVAKTFVWSGTSGDNFIVVDPSGAGGLRWWQNKVGEAFYLTTSDSTLVLNGVQITAVERTHYPGQGVRLLIYFNDTLTSSYSNQTDGSALAKVRRFHCNGYVDGNKTVMENAKELLANMRGIFLYIDGKYELSIEDTGSSTFSITDDHIIQDQGISVDYGNKDKKANKVIVEYFNANKKYELDTATVLHDASPEYYSDDGEILEIKAEFPYVTDPYIAYNMGKAILTRSRNQTTMQFLGTPEMYKLNVGDIVSLTYTPLGFSGKVCRVEALELQSNGLVAVSLIEYFDVYTWEVPPQEDFEELSDIPSAYNVKKPTNITFTDTDASSTNRPFLAWDLPTDYPYHQWRVNVVDSSSNQVLNKIVDINNVDLSFIPKANGYIASITALNSLGVESDAETKTFSVGDAPTATDDLQDGSVTNVKIDTLSAAKINTGELNLGQESGMAVRQTKTGYTSTATGFWLGNDGGTPKFNIGSSTNYLKFDGSGLDIAGQISATTGSIGGFTVGTTSLTAGSGTSKISLSTADGIHLGANAFADAPFSVNLAGSLTAQSATLSGTIKSNQSFSSGSSTRTVKIDASSNALYTLTAGSETPTEAPFRVKSDGTVEIFKLDLFLSDGVTKIFDADTGFTNNAFSEIAADLGTAISDYTKPLASNTEAQKITLTSTQNVTVKAIKSAFMVGWSPQSSSYSKSRIPTKVRMRLMHSLNSNLSNANELATLGSSWTAGVDRIDDGTPTSTQYKIQESQQVETGFTFYEWVTQNLSGDAIDDNFEFSISSTASYTGSASGTDHYFFIEIDGTGGSTFGANSTTSTAARSLNISGVSFYISNGDAADTGEGDITAVYAGTNLNGGGTAGAVTLNLDSTILGNHTFSNNLVIQGNLDVQGTTTTIDTANLDVKDKNITLNYGTGDTSANANGAGITIQDAVSAGNDATLTWNTSNDSFNFSHPVNVTGNIGVTGTVDGRDIATDGSKLDGIETGATTDQTQSEINALGITATGLSGTPNITVGTINSGAITSTGLTVNGSGIITNTASTTTLTLAGNTGSVAGLRLQAEEVHADIFGVNEGNNYGGLKIQTNSNGTLKDRLKIESNGDISFYEDTGTTAKFFWDASDERLDLTGSDYQFGIKQGSNQPWYNRAVSDGSYRLHLNSVGDILTATSTGVTVTGNVTATAFYGDGSNLTGVTSTTINNNADNRIITGSGTANTLNAESGLTYNGSTLSGANIQMTGNINASGVSANNVSGDVLQINSTTVVDNSRNLTNIGTISSGAITSTGPNASTSDWGNEGISSKFVINAANRTYGGLVFKDSAIKGAGVGFRYDGSGYKLELGTASSTSSGISTHLTIDRVGAIVTSGHLDVGNNLDVSGTISSGAITSSGFTFTNGGDRYITGPLNSSLIINAKPNDSTEGLKLQINGVDKLSLLQSGNATFAGTISSGDITISDATPTLKFTDTDNNYDATIAGLSGSLVLKADSGAEFGTETIQFHTSGSQKVTIDASGNLLVGTTNSSLSSSSSATGINLKPNGASAFVRDGGTVLYINRLSSDGTILDFRKDGSTVGSIGAANGDLNINGGSGHSGIRFQASSLLPRLNGSDTNGTIDLGYDDGSAIHRFRNLYLSGTARSNTVSINGTTVIDSSRNLTNIGNITASGNLNVGSNAVINQASSDSTYLKVNHSSSGDGGILLQRANANKWQITSNTSHHLVLDSLGGGDVLIPTGNLGISTSSPSAKLDVNKGSSGNVASFKTGAANVNDYAGITLHSYTISNVDWYGSEMRSINTASSPSYLNPRLGFFTQNNNTHLPADRTEKMSILGNGNCGIGTDNPSDKLSLNGAVNASTGLTIGNNNSTRVRLYHSDAGGYSALTTDGMGTEQPLIIGSGQYLAFYTNGSERLRIDASGNIEHGTSQTTIIDSSRNLTNIGTISSGAITSSASLKATDYRVNEGSSLAGGLFKEKNVTGSGSSNDLTIFAEGISNGGNIHFMTGGSATIRATIDTSGDATFSGNVTAYSDERLKENIETLDSKKALQMRGVSFIKDGVKGSGVIAQEVEEIAPELVLTADDEMGTKSVAYGNLVGYLIETVKDQQKQIDELKQRLDNDS